MLGIKKLVLKQLNYADDLTADQIIRAVKGYDVISFDIFDTLIKRAVLEPEEVFEIVANKFNENNGLAISCGEYRQARRKAEELARKVTDKNDVTLDDIFEQLDSEYKSYADELKELEKETEALVCYANPVMKKVYDWCIREEKIIITISDMYLPQSVIDRILKDNGYARIDATWVSGVVDCCKRNLSIYNYALDKLGIDKKEMVHIGDNYVTDYLAPKKIGIKTVHIAKYPSRVIYANTGKCDRRIRTDYKRLLKLLDNYENPDWDDYTKYGFEVVGPVVYGLCELIHKKKETDEKAFFLARDGYIIKKVYDYLYPKENTTYLYVSRRALHVPCHCLDSRIETVFGSNTPTRRWTYETICEDLGIDSHEHKSKWEACELDASRIYVTKQLLESENFKKFYDQIENEMVANSRKELDMLRQYLEEMGLNGKSIIVDVGWNGTLQIYLNNILDACNMDSKVRGFYLSLQEGKISQYETCQYLSSDKHVNDLSYGLLEVPFLALEGSTRKYLRYNDKIEPVKYDYEYDSWMAGKLEKIQNGIMLCAQLMKKNAGLLCNTEDAMYENLRQATKRPGGKVVQVMGEFLYDNNGERERLVSGHGLAYYCVHPQVFKYDFQMSAWKCGFMKSVFSIDIDYYRLISQIREFIRNK